MGVGLSGTKPKAPDGGSRAVEYPQVFYPTAQRRYEAAVESNQRLAYYTSAETAYKIIRTGKVWLRDASAMNDSAET